MGTEDALARKVSQMEEIFRWLLGENGDFKPVERDGPLYAWRTELRKRLLAVDPALARPCIKAD